VNRPASPDDANYWLVVPAAGTGRRMRQVTPKQYLPLAGKNVITHALAPFDRNSLIQSIIVVLRSHDAYWTQHAPAISKPLQLVDGGPTRGQSVLNGLNVLTRVAADNDWVLIHDAARPCLTDADLESLLLKLHADEVGGLLASPLEETLKHADDMGTGGMLRVKSSIASKDIWRALTPQMYRFGPLRRAVASCITAGVEVADEACAMEKAGHDPALVKGRSDNIKVTTPADLTLAEAILRNHGIC